MVEIFSGVSRGLSASAAAPFISGGHAALLLMVGTSIVRSMFSVLHCSGPARDARQRALGLLQDSLPKKEPNRL